MLMHRTQTPQPGFGSVTLKKIHPPFQNPGSVTTYGINCVIFFLNI